MSAHTPGPWNLSGKYPSARVQAGEFEFLLTNWRGDSPDVWLANTRLCAAAPELLTALKMAEAYASLNTVDSRPPTPEQLATWRAAIAKAEQGAK